jgi:hypothetical protein
LVSADDGRHEGILLNVIVPPTAEHDGGLSFRSGRAATAAAAEAEAAHGPGVSYGRQAVELERNRGRPVRYVRLASSTTMTRLPLYSAVAAALDADEQLVFGDGAEEVWARRRR